jgi:hypothetical protein
MSPVHKLSAMGSLTTNKTDYPSMLAGNASFVAGMYESIATVTAGAGTLTNIVFTSIPQTYSHLQLRGIINQAYSANDNGYAAVELNSVAVSYRHFLWGTGSSPVGYSDAAGAMLDTILSSTATTTFAPFVLDILDYTNTNKAKTLRALTGWDNNGSGNVYMTSGLWNNTSAVNSISILGTNGNYRQFSQVALYGIKGV